MAKRKKNRRIKKTKYLSLLSLQFPGEKPLFKDHIPNNIIPIPTTTTTTTTDHHHQLDLLLEKDGDDNMEYLLSASVDDDGGATTLTGLLLDSSSAADHVPVVVSSSDGADDELSPSAASVSYVSEAMNLVRTALRSRERDSSTHEERYVRYSEVVDDQRRRDHDEVSSRIAAVGGGGGDRNSSKKNEYHYQDPTSSMLMRRHRLSLKLDYQEIMNAWSDKGGFYVHSDFPQTVPDIIDDFFCHPPIPNGGGLWSVPEGTGGAMSMLKMEEEEEEEEEVVVPQDEDRPHREEEEWEWKWKAAAGQREASVLRYKEKRRNRLFSKTIRYQVRKENAQKRPRVKGRFVKRN